MIKTKRGEIKISGITSEILADISLIVKAVNKNLVAVLGKEKARERIMKAVERGFYTDEERHSELQEVIEKAIGKCDSDSEFEKKLDLMISKFFKDIKEM